MLLIKLSLYVYTPNNNTIDNCFYVPTTGSDIREILDEPYKRYEILFPQFTSQQPWREEANFYEKQEETIPIFKLVHITHDVEAGSIQENNLFTFISKMKVGKAYEKDGSPLGETYKEVAENKYLEIPRSKANPVFPGYWSWWGIDTRKWMGTEPKPNLSTRVRMNHSSGSYAPGYLASPVGSCYGNNAFSIGLQDILSDYKQSRPDKPGKEICLKIGGTLRYRHEICYVVMVCMENDIRHVPNITGPTPPFDPNGLVDEHGLVVDYSATPNFIIQSIVRKVGYDYYDWEQLAFSFYFPKEGQALMSTNVEVSMNSVTHNPPRCTSTIPKPAGGSWVCPNMLGKPKKTE